MATRGLPLLRHLIFMFALFLILGSIFSSYVSATDDQLFILSAAQPTTLKLTSGVAVKNSPGSKPGSLMSCKRVRIYGLSRLHNLKKYANLVRVKLTFPDVTPKGRLKIAEVCTHRNMSLQLGMCPEWQWVKVTKGSWVRSMSPYDNMYLDIRMPGSTFEILEVSTEEEFLFHRTIFLVVGIVLLTLAPTLSNSLAFYNGSGMAVGIILFILLILFQGMKVLPRKNSLAMVLYSCFVGAGSYLLGYLPQLLQSVLVELGIREEMHSPLLVFLGVCIFLVGAWFGLWVVRRLILEEDGSIDSSTAHFFAWSIRIFAAVMIVLSSLDWLLAGEALLIGIFISSMTRRILKLRMLYRLQKYFFRTTTKSSHRRSKVYGSPIEDRSDRHQNSCSLPITGPGAPSSWPSESDTFYSTFHETPERKLLSKEDYDKLTRDSTKKGLEELVSSPDFNKWAVAHAERITLTPLRTDSKASVQQSNFFNWG